MVRICFACLLPRGVRVLGFRRRWRIGGAGLDRARDERQLPGLHLGAQRRADSPGIRGRGAGHLDEMQRTDKQPAENRDRYNMAVTQEALCFLERYPDRKQELINRIREGRVYVSPYLCNSLWGMQVPKAFCVPSIPLADWSVSGPFR